MLEKGVIVRTSWLFLGLILGPILGLASTSAGQQSIAALQQPEASVDVWQETTARGDAAMSISDFVTGERIYREALAFAQEHNLGTAAIAGSNADLGWSLRAQRRYAESEAVYRTALQLYSGIDSENSEDVLQGKLGLGIALTGLGQYEEAENLLLGVLSVYNGQPKVTACTLSFPLDALTMLFKASHQYSKGEQVYMEVFALMTGKHGTPCENFLLLTEHLASLYEDDHQWEMVEKIHRGRASLARNMKGPTSILYGDALVAIAQTLDKRQQNEQAATTYAQAANVYRHSRPPAMSKLAITLDREELSLYKAGKAEQARLIHQATLAAEKSSTENSLHGQMMAVRSQGVEAMNNGQKEKAEQDFSQELALSQGLAAADQMIALSDSAYFHQNLTHQLPEAEAELKQVLTLSVATTGPSSRATADAHFGLGWFYFIAKRLTDAEESFSSALALYGPDETKELDHGLQLLAGTYVQDGKYDQAVAIYQRAIKLDEDTHNDGHLVVMLTGIGEAYLRANRFNEAETALQRAMALSEHLAKPINQAWFGAAMTMASVYEQSGRPQLAEQLFLRIVSFVEREAGPNSPAMRLPLDKLVALTKSQGRLTEANEYEARKNKLPEMPPLP